MKRIGILSLQGDSASHRKCIEELKAEAVPVRYPDELQGVHGLILPGGESTTIGKLMKRHGLLSPLARKLEEGFPVFATCAGAVLLARRLAGDDLPRLAVMSVVVQRNAYGRQVDSFEADIVFSFLGPPPVRCVFIRAPIILESGKDVEILGSFEERPVLVRQGKLLAATFHPELTADTRIHRYFLERVVGG